MKTIYLIKHSGPFVDIENYSDYKNVLWEDYNRNMILSVEAEEKAKLLCNIEELKEVDEIYASDSVRAIATAKYLAAFNNIKVKLDDRINERKFGIEYLRDLPEDFNKKSFEDKCFKLENGESFNEVDMRFIRFINEIMNNDCEKVVIVLHGLILLSYLETLCEFKFDGNSFKIIYREKVILDGNPKSPDVYKFTFDDKHTLIDIENINIVI